MDLATLAELGGTGLLAFVLYLVVKMFIKYLSKRDEQFGSIISNHINHNTKALQKNTDSNREILKFLKNGK